MTTRVRWAWVWVALAGCQDADLDGAFGSDDCDDTDPFVSPEAFEVPYDGKDNDCDPRTRDDDLDEDGFARDEDCNDGDPAISPEGIERCNRVDDDCDGLPDDDAGTGWFADDDGDGAGDPARGITSCDGASGLVADDSDCDDTDAAIRPGVDEHCDGVDEDCDGEIDDGGVDPATWYPDADGDGHGDPETGIDACTPPADHVAAGDDCDDTRASVNPDATEVCDDRDRDEDCTGTADDLDPGVDPTTFVQWFLDNDGDGVGGPFPGPLRCDGGPTLSDLGNDCADADATRSPLVPETCNGRDDDCDGSSDEGLPVVPSWYDGDGDGYGNPFFPAPPACATPPGFVADATDCNDLLAAIHPGAPEVCDGLDNDCDSDVDPDSTWFLDVDGDGHGDPAFPLAWTCGSPPGHAAVDDDCDDADATRYPGAIEQCDGLDNDCDGPVDEGAVAVSWYADGDGDGFGDPSFAQSDCSAPVGHVALGGDCADGDRFTFPGAPEVCDGVDNDCDGTADDTADAVPWYADTDGDGVGDEADRVSSCAPVAGRVRERGDCDDGLAERRPGNAEICDGLDNDCDGYADEGDVPRTWFQDGDGDGAGDPGVVTHACTRPTGFVGNALDCADGDPTRSPAVPEVCNGVDDDCDAYVDDGVLPLPWYPDGDGDGEGAPYVVAWACAQPPSTVANDTDCNDGAVEVGAGATEVCDGLDNDCDGVIDEDAPPSVWSWDGDGDGYGTGTNQVLACTQPPGYVADASDCDDGNAQRNAGAVEVCDFVDNDCDGVPDDGAVPTMWWYDGDGDGFGQQSALSACTQPAQYVAVLGDCDDGNPARAPGLVETCDGIDNDCDLYVDDGVLPPTWYADGDGDGHGAPGSPAVACAAPVGYVSDGTDCHDGDASVAPGATEICDGVDQDCDGIVDEGATPPLWYWDVDGDGLGGSPAFTACTFPGAPFVAAPSDCDDGIPGDDCALHWFLDGDGDGHGDLAFPSAPGTPGTVSDRLDCNDGDLTVYGGATEVCNGVDDDCDGVIDDGAPPTLYFGDADGDGDGSPYAPLWACAPPATYVTLGTDCNDGDGSVRPGVPDLCNQIDDDCDGFIDEDAPPAVWFLDSDGDGHGQLYATAACAVPAGWVATFGDCDDGNAQRADAFTDVCDGVDNDCDGVIDDDDVPPTFWSDTDGDGYGSVWSPVAACAPAPGLAPNPLDCDDGNAFRRPGLPDLCDGTDTDCDLRVDEDEPTTRWFYDYDGDGFGQPGGWIDACTQPAQTTSDRTDCDDGNALRWPGAADVCDGVDQDCDGYADDDDPPLPFWWDTDGDGFGSGQTWACSAPASTSTVAGDCYDSDPTFRPGAPDPCDGQDQDCDGYADDEDPPPLWYPDADEDLWGTMGGAYNQCDAPTRFASPRSGDCNDAAIGTSPSMPELCTTLADDDCDGAVNEGCP